MLTSAFTLFTAVTASPSEAPGARLKESVTTGNWPWWFTVMGAFISSTWVKAASGTCPPLGNCEVDAICPPPKALSEPIVEERPEEEVEFDKLVVAAVTELVGPNN